MTSPRNRFGFTMIEVLLVIAILGIIAAFTIPMLIRYQVRSDLANASSMIMQGVDRARVLSQAGYHDSAWGFSMEHGVLFKGESYDERDPAFDEYFPINETIIPSGTSEVWFEKVTGKPNAPGSIITLTGNDGQLQTIDLELNDAGTTVIAADLLLICQDPGTPQQRAVYVSDAQLPSYIAQGNTVGSCPALAVSSSSQASTASTASSAVSTASAASSVSSRSSSSSVSSAAAGGGTSSVATAVATKGLFLLAASGQGMLNITGNGTLTVGGPGDTTVNSTHGSAITITGNGRIVTPDIYVGGNPGTSAPSGSQISGTVHSGSAAVSDPLVSLPQPTATNTLSRVTVSGNATVTLTPNAYQGITVSGNGRLNLNPGVYQLKGNLSVSGNAIVTGSGVTIYNESGVITLSGNGQITLRPPSSGTYAGVTLFQKRTLTNAISISGNGNLSITGALYAPAAAFTLSGNGASNAFGSLVIGKSLSLSGNASFQVR